MSGDLGVDMTEISRFSHTARDHAGCMVPLCLYEHHMGWWWAHSACMLVGTYLYMYMGWPCSVVHACMHLLT